MATLRRYSIVKTRRPAKMFSPERAILGLFVVAAGAGVFIAVDGATRDGHGPLQQLAAGKPLVNIPIAHHIAETLNRLDGGINGKAVIKPVKPTAAQIAARDALRQRQLETAQRLAAERRQLSQQIYARRNVDRTPVASIPSTGPAPASPGFTEVRPLAGAKGFQELPAWQRR